MFRMIVGAMAVPTGLLVGLVIFVQGYTLEALFAYAFVWVIMAWVGEPRRSYDHH